MAARHDPWPLASGPHLLHCQLLRNRWAWRSCPSRYTACPGAHLHALQASFQQLLDVLRSLDYKAYDVTATKWFDDFNAFKAGLWDLDTLLINVLDTAFEQTGSLVDRILLTEVSWQPHDPCCYSPL